MLFLIFLLFIHLLTTVSIIYTVNGTESLSSYIEFSALNGLIYAEVPLRNHSLTYFSTLVYRL